MHPVLRNILAVVAGLLIGSAINMGIIMIGPMLIPLPEGVDMSDREKFAENLKLFRPIDFVTPWLAHALGTLLGAFVAAKIATTRKMIFALGIGVFFLLGGITVFLMYQVPIWFAIIDIVGAYIPMAYLGGMLAGKGGSSKALSEPNE